MTAVARYRLLSVLLATALAATLAATLTAGQRADALDGPVEVVYVATGRNFPDALAGSTLAAARDAPLLTVDTDLPLPPATITALQALDPDRIVVLGGSAAVSTGVVDVLRGYARSGQVTRIAGEDRHATAAAIADALPDPSPLDADLLDGRDATDFLGVDDVASDSDRLGGRPPAAYRILPLGWRPGPNATGDTPPMLPDGVTSSARTGLRLPGTYQAGTPVTIDVLLSQGSTTACGVYLAVNASVNTPGFYGSWAIQVDVAGAGTNTVTLAVPSGNTDSNFPLLLELVAPDDPPGLLSPGTQVDLSLYRIPSNADDTCSQPVGVYDSLVYY